MTTLNPYIYFNGNCEEAFNFYKTDLKKDITYVVRCKDIPKKDRKFKKN